MRYMIVSEEMGAFVGTYMHYMLFSEESGAKFGFTNVYTFENEATAEDFLKMTNGNVVDCKIVPIDTKQIYVHVVDVVKAGYGNYVKEMVHNLEMISELVH